eukprot:1196202-Prorocentrum_minimum.AAC.2
MTTVRSGLGVWCTQVWTSLQIGEEVQAGLLAELTNPFKGLRAGVAALQKELQALPETVEAFDALWDTETACFNMKVMKGSARTGTAIKTKREQRRADLEGAHRGTLSEPFWEDYRKAKRHINELLGMLVLSDEIKTAICEEITKPPAEVLEALDEVVRTPRTPSKPQATKSRSERRIGAPVKQEAISTNGPVRSAIRPWRLVAGERKASEVWTLWALVWTLWASMWILWAFMWTLWPLVN